MFSFQLLWDELKPSILSSYTSGLLLLLSQIFPTPRNETVLISGNSISTCPFHFPNHNLRVSCCFGFTAAFIKKEDVFERHTCPYHGRNYITGMVPQSFFLSWYSKLSWKMFKQSLKGPLVKNGVGVIYSAARIWTLWYLRFFSNITFYDSKKGKNNPILPHPIWVSSALWVPKGGIPTSLRMVVLWLARERAHPGMWLSGHYASLPGAEPHCVSVWPWPYVTEEAYTTSSPSPSLLLSLPIQFWRRWILPGSIQAQDNFAKINLVPHRLRQHTYI